MRRPGSRRRAGPAGRPPPVVPRPPPLYTPPLPRPRRRRGRLYIAPPRGRRVRQRAYYLVNWDRAAALAAGLWDRAAGAAGGRRFECIATASRGGIVPARLLADASGIGRIAVDAASVPAGSLFVDDIYDTGRTFRDVAGRAEDPESLVYATLFARRGRAETPPQLVFAEETAGAEHVVFPWEMGEHRREVSP